MNARSMFVLLVTLLLAAMALTGCSSPEEEPAEEAELQPLRIGTLTTEDALPLWAAEDLGLYDEAGMPSVEIITFQSAAERDTALVAGEIDAFMGDIIAAAALENGGTEVTIATIMLGSTPEEGRFGIVAAPETAYVDLTALAGVPVGTSSATIQEYVLDGLMRQAGVPAEDVAKEEVKKVPVRFDLLMNGQISAAALPEPLLSLAEFQGATLLADDTEGENLSQTVLVFSDEYLSDPGGLDTMVTLLDVWDLAAEEINADPDAWRDTLVDKARLPEPIRDTYDVNTYPLHDVPTDEQVGAVIDWMMENELLDEEVTYEQLVVVMP